jgi:zinc protease
MPGLLFLIALVATSCGGAPRALVMRDVSFPMRDLRFPSGLRVIVEEDHRAPVVGVFTLVGSGSTSDPPGKEGLAHYVEHLAFRARPDGEHSVWNLLERAGAGDWNASTGFDYTLYYEIGPKEALPAFVLLEGVRMLGPVAHVAALTGAVERQVVRNELRQRNETGFIGSILAALQAAVFPPGHPYARPVGGSHESLSAITLDDARSFAAAHYRPENITMVVVGDVDQATVARTIEEGLPPALKAGAQGRAASPRLAPTAPDPPAPPAGAMTRMEAAVATPELWIGWSLPRSFGEDGYLDDFVERSASGKLPTAFFTDPDISGLQVDLVPGTEAAMLLCRVLLREGSHPERSADHVLNQLIQLWNPRPEDPHAGVDTENLAFVNEQRSAVTAMMLDVETLATRGSQRAELTHFSGDPTAYSHALRAIMGIDAARVSTFAYRYLTRDRARSVLVSPLPASARPPPGGGALAPMADEEPPPGLDAKAMRAFTRPPGVGGFRHFTLANGVEVIAGRLAGLPVVTVAVSLHGGRATATPPGAVDLAGQLAHPAVASKVTPSDFGGHFDERFDRDAVTYAVEGSSGNVANMLALLADWVPAMHVEADEASGFDREIVPYLQKAELLPEIQADRAFLKTLWGPHPYGRSTAAAELSALGAGDANGWVRRDAVPKNAVVAVVGEIEPDEVAARAEETFGRWSDAAPAEPPPPAPVLPSARAPRPSFVVTHRPGATQGEVRLGCLLPPARSRARYDVMGSLLGERVTAVVRRQLGASYGFQAGAETLRGGAAGLILEGAIDNAGLAKGLGVVRAALESLEQGRFDPGEVDRSRWRVARGYIVEYGTTAAIAGAILAARNQDRDVAAIDAYPDDLAAVDAAALQEGFARCATAPVLAVVGDEPTVRAAIAAAWP